MPIGEQNRPRTDETPPSLPPGIELVKKIYIEPVEIGSRREEKEIPLPLDQVPTHALPTILAQAKVVAEMTSAPDPAYCWSYYTDPTAKPLEVVSYVVQRARPTPNTT